MVGIVVGNEVGDFPVPRSLIRRLAEFLDDCESQSPNVLNTGHPPLAVHRPKATQMGDGQNASFLEEPEEGDAARPEAHPTPLCAVFV
jgi:hypothetical protein